MNDPRKYFDASGMDVKHAERCPPVQDSASERVCLFRIKYSWSVLHKAALLLKLDDN